MTGTARRAAKRAAMAAARANADALGLCKCCLKRPRTPGRSRCASCDKPPAERRTGHGGYHRRREPAVCDECIAVGFHRADCPTLKKEP